MAAIFAEEPLRGPLDPPASKWHWVLVAARYHFDVVGSGIRDVFVKMLLGGVMGFIEGFVSIISRWACRTMPDSLIAGDACAF